LQRRNNAKGPWGSGMDARRRVPCWRRLDGCSSSLAEAERRRGVLGLRDGRSPPGSSPQPTSRIPARRRTITLAKAQRRKGLLGLRGGRSPPGSVLRGGSADAIYLSQRRRDAEGFCGYGMDVAAWFVTQPTSMSPARRRTITLAKTQYRKGDLGRRDGRSPPCSVLEAARRLQFISRRGGETQRLLGSGRTLAAGSSLQPTSTSPTLRPVAAAAKPSPARSDGSGNSAARRSGNSAAPRRKERGR